MHNYYLLFLLFIATTNLVAQQSHKDMIEAYYENINLKKLDSIALTLNLKDVKKIKLITNFKVSKKGKITNISVMSFKNREITGNIHNKPDNPFKQLEVEMIRYMKQLEKIPPHINDGLPTEKKYMYMVIIDLKKAEARKKKQLD